ncbi:MAG: FAD:protein FMN transferase, partial [Phycisphaerales bacterium]|nr:FAD:protein FMN transferase [Phycisphaerales bacterium]
MSTGDPLRLACPAMGTRFELILIGDRGADAARLRAAGEEALDEVRRWHDLLSFFDKASIVARINREAAEGGRPLPVPPDAADLLRLCLELAAATGGAFDIAVGHLMRRAGFRGDAPGADGHTHARTATVRGRTVPPNPCRPAGFSDRSDPPA